MGKKCLFHARDRPLRSVNSFVYSCLLSAETARKTLTWAEAREHVYFGLRIDSVSWSLTGLSSCQWWCESQGEQGLTNWQLSRWSVIENISFLCLTTEKHIPLSTSVSRKSYQLPCCFQTSRLITEKTRSIKEREGEKKQIQLFRWAPRIQPAFPRCFRSLWSLYLSKYDFGVNH